MGANSGIEWTTHSFNAIRGCSKVSPGCQNCYADNMAKINPGLLGVFGNQNQGGTRVVAAETMWKQPLIWNKAAEGLPKEKRPRVFCQSMGDLFEDWHGPITTVNGETAVWPNERSADTPWEWFAESKFPGEHPIPVSMSAVRSRVFDLISKTPNLDWLILTKRPESIPRMWAHEGPAKNVWLGTSVENQKYAEIRIPKLLDCRYLAPVLFLSCEPLLGSVDLLTSRFMGVHRNSIDWVIAGGESGPGCRPCNIQWLRSLKEQCKATKVPYFLKQFGTRPVDEACKCGHFRSDHGNFTDECNVCSVSDHPGDGCKAYNSAGSTEPLAYIRHKKGGDWDEWPDYLRVREFPDL